MIKNLGNDLHQIYQGDAIKVMDYLIENNIKVDAIITDIPYGTTNNKWDSVIPFDLMWDRLYKIKKNPQTPILLFADDPFAAHLQLSNKDYRYKYFWDKNKGTGFLDVAWKPLKVIEQILVFIEKPFVQVLSKESYKKYDRIAQYFPQYTIGKPNHSTGNKLTSSTGTTYGKHKTQNQIKITKRANGGTEFYRKDILRIEKNVAYKQPINLLKFGKAISTGGGLNYTQLLSLFL